MKISCLALALVVLQHEATVTSFTLPVLSYNGKRGLLYHRTSANEEDGPENKVVDQLTQGILENQDHSDGDDDASLLHEAANKMQIRNGSVASDGEATTGSLHSEHQKLGSLASSRKARQKEAFPVFSAFFASPGAKRGLASPEKANGKDDPHTEDSVAELSHEKDDVSGPASQEEAVNGKLDPRAKDTVADLNEEDDAWGSSNEGISHSIIKEMTEPHQLGVSVKLPESNGATELPDQANGAVVIPSANNGAVEKVQQEEDSQSKANDEKEQMRRYNEYKATSMDKLRLDVDEAKQQAVEAKERVTSMQQRVDELQKELDFAEEEYQLYLSTQEEESKSISARMDELKGLIQAKEDRKRQAERNIQAAAEKGREKLVKELEDVKFALRQAKEELDHEKEASAQIQSRLAQAEKQAKEEKASFDIEENDMRAEIETQKSKIADAETRMELETSVFEEERVSLGKMLQEQITRLAETNARKLVEQAHFSTEQLKVQRDIDEIYAKLAATEKALKAEKKRSVKEIENLEKSAAELTQKLKRAKEKLESEQRASQKAKEGMEMKLVFEKVRAKNLADELTSQQALHRREMKDLETISAENRAELAKAEALLRSTRARLLKESNALKDQVADSKRIRKLKAKQMSQRYRKIREEMTARWQGERRQARHDQKELINAYTSQLSDLDGAVPRLESELTEVLRTNEDLRDCTETIMQERDAILQEGRRSEMRYLQTKQERNVAISALENEIDDLKVGLAHKNEKIATYSSSLRAMFGLSMTLAKERFGEARKRLLGRIRKRKKRLQVRRLRGTTGLLNTNRGGLSTDYDNNDNTE